MILNTVYGLDKTKLPPLYYASTGTPDYAQEVQADGTVNWELAIKKSCTLTFTRVVDAVDVFLVGGGAPGGNSDGGYGGQGGKGGGRTTQSSVTLNEGTGYAIVIGGSGKATTGFGYTAATGGGSDGGAGADYRSTLHGKSGSSGAYAFGSSASLLYSGRKYGPGGGGGGYVQSANNVYNGGDGGTTGGGHGADRSHTAAADSAGTANTGGGGGGACYDAPYNKSYGPGTGGSGIIIIRNHRA